MGATLSFIRVFLSWSLPVCVVGVIIADFRMMRRERLTFASLRTHKHSLASYQMLTLLLLVMTCLTYWLVAGSPADMFVLSRPESVTSLVSASSMNKGFNARMLFLPTFTTFLAMMMLNTWFAATGSGPKTGMCAVGADAAAALLTLLVLAWGDLGISQHHKCLSFCPLGQVCDCAALYRATVPIVAIQFVLIVMHAAASVWVWRASRSYDKLDGENGFEGVDMESRPSVPRFDFDMTRL